MTEQEWLTSEDPTAMLKWLRKKQYSDRKLRLFACACLRQVWHLLTDERSRMAVDVAERYADNLATKHELQEAEWAGHASYIDNGRVPFSPEDAIGSCVGGPVTAILANRYLPLAIQANLLRDVIGNPFQPKPETCKFFKSNGRRPHVCETHKIESIKHGVSFGCPKDFQVQFVTRDVKAIASTIYTERQWQDVPILADALQDAGCTESDVLAHLCSPEPHVRGCWVLDLVLGKE